MKRKFLAATVLVVSAILPMVALADNNISEAYVSKLSKLYEKRASFGRHLESLNNGELHIFITEDWGFTSLDDPEVINAVRQSLIRQCSELDAEIKNTSSAARKDAEARKERETHYVPSGPGVGA